MHGGPTASAGLALNLEFQYYTSRGIGVLDLNYRGSTGFGRVYRDKLRKKYKFNWLLCSNVSPILLHLIRWGVYDVDDAVHGALHLSQTGEVDEERLVISGGSAGGFTVLAALAFKDAFRVGKTS